MSLQPYGLKKRKYTSPASRNSYYFFNKLNYQHKFKKLAFFKKSFSGRNDSGVIVIRTKKSLKIKNKSLRVNYNLRYFRLGFIAGFQFIPFKNRLLSLIYFSNGAVTYYLTNVTQNLFFFFNI
jgi:ribosomal protein L2